MKFLFIGLGSISTKHIKDLFSIASKQSIGCEITILRRAIGELQKDLGSYNIKQITHLDSTVYDVAFITNPTNLHYQVLKELKDVGVAECINPEVRKGRLYRLTDTGNEIANSLDSIPIKKFISYNPNIKKYSNYSNVYLNGVHIKS